MKYYNCSEEEYELSVKMLATAISGLLSELKRDEYISVRADMVREALDDYNKKVIGD